MTAAMRPGVERSREGGQAGAPVCLVITPTIEQAMTAADQARHLLADPSVRVVPVTGAVRARRVLGLAPVAVVTGTPADLLAVRRDAALSVEQLQTVVIVGLDEILAANGADTLQALLGDAPENVSRVATLEQENDASDAFLEAQLRRARRINPPVIGDTPLAVTPRFVLTSPAGRVDALRLVLDETDPPSLVVITASDAGMADATAALARLGVAVDGLSVQVTRQPTAQHVALAVLWEAPLTHDALVEALAMRPVDAVALLLPDELPAFRRMTLNLAEAWTPAPRKAGAEDRVQQLRTALRSTLANGNASASELALLAPLLETHDALELACAALRLYEGARRDALNLRAKAATAGAKSTVRDTPREQTRGGDAPAAPAGRQRVFLAAGKRDNVRVGDIVGAIANEAGVPGEKIGQVDLFESHATVELDAADAAKAVAALGSATLRGRRLSARIDERSNERPAFGDRPRREFGGDRGGDRGPRRDFGDRGPRRDGGDRGPRRDFGGDRGPRREGGERGDRPARSFDRGDRGPRRDAGGDRGADRGPRGGFGGGGFGGGRPPRTADERRSWGDRPVGERTEGRGEWSERAERMKHAKRERPARPSFGQDGEA
ncbi:DbpA RNA binding domain-containing protein [Gemmatimonas sp.]|uniref:DbpA RNA binding domain-containing protein n=1 Tax=Gemmatimonas sp. TaxID=1962908 RepID=UPI0027B8A6FC|nr:DbpA RNA binding domain-containing protein [Gemmatimonas sp.]